MNKKRPAPYKKLDRLVWPTHPANVPEVVRRFMRQGWHLESVNKKEADLTEVSFYK